MQWLTPVLDDLHAKLLALPADHPAPVYLLKRGVSTEDVKTHRIGWLENAYDVRTGTRDFLDWTAKYGWGRLVFPLLDGLGQPFGIVVRKPVEGDRAVNWVGVPGELQPVVYGLHQGLPAVYQSGRCILVEGIFDYFAIRRWAPDTTALLTSHAGANVRRLLSRYCTRVVALTDMDAPGRRGAYLLAGVVPPAEYQKPNDPIRKVPATPPFLVQLPAYSEKDPGKLYEVGKFEELQRLAKVGL